MSGQQGETKLKQCAFNSCADGFVNWNRTLASSMVLAVLMAISAGQAPAVEIIVKAQLSPKDVKALVANAKTPADHMKLAHHYTAMAAKHEAEAQEHEALAVGIHAEPAVGCLQTHNGAEHRRTLQVLRGALPQRRERNEGYGFRARRDGQKVEVVMLLGLAYMSRSD
jgi:hypothetical protein